MVSARSLLFGRDVIVRHGNSSLSIARLTVHTLRFSLFLDTQTCSDWHRQPSPSHARLEAGENMDTTTILIVLVVLLLLGGGGFFYRRRV